MDHEFHEQLPKLFPHVDARPWFAGNQPLIESSAFRNSTLQGAYFIIAARALGLDTGPMSGFDNAGGRCRFLRRHADQVELHLHARPRRSGDDLRAQPALRRSKKLNRII